MKGTYDKSVDAAYLKFVDEIKAGESKRQAVVEADGLRAMVVLDFDDEDYILGIEIVGDSDVLRPETLDSLRRIG